ncbi:MAG: hypothetical protein LBQ39_07860 [Tannerellaceae bacterium]|jgi:hypothetical protein|nr:hypothetical protein [Tannerellaceae bacterium]
MRFNKQMFDHVRKSRGMEFLERNMRVEIDGKQGVVVGHSNSGLTAKLDNGREVCFHPTWKIVYFDNDGNIVADYRN